jgi:hypothetical protein
MVTLAMMLALMLAMMLSEGEGLRRSTLQSIDPAPKQIGTAVVALLFLEEGQMD